MATSSVRSKQHYIMVSAARESDNAAPQTRNIAFRMTDNADLSPSTPTWLRRDAESGTRSWPSEGTMQPGRMEWTKEYRDNADDSNCAFFGIFASSGEVAGAVSQIGTTGVYIQDIEGPSAQSGAQSNIKAFALEDVGLPGGSNDSLNRLVPNVFPETVVISGQAGGFMNISASLRGCGLDAPIGGAPTTPVYYRNRVFRFSDMALISNLTCGGTVNSSGFTTPPTSAGFLADTDLVVAEAVDLTSICKSITLTISNPVNLDDSYQPGSIDANGFAVVPALGWLRVGHSVRIEAKFLLGDANSQLFRAEHRAGTQRGIEMWLKHPTAITAGAYAGCRMTLPYSDMIAYVPSTDGLGPKYVTCTWEAVDDGTNKSWRYIAANTFTEIIAY